MRRDQAHMALLADHRMCAVGITLAGPVVAVCVNIGDYRHLLASAEIPKRHKAGAMEDDDARIQSRGIKIVVADELGDFPRALGAQQKCAALTLAAAATAELAKRRIQSHNEMRRGSLVIIKWVKATMDKF